MALVALHVVIAVLVWWLATGAVILLTHGERAEARSTRVIIHLTGLASVGILLWSGSLVSTLGVYMGFLGAIGAWAWHEASFLNGSVAGPSRSPCPPDLAGWDRFIAAFQTMRNHELGLALTLAALALVQFQMENRTGLHVFALLWAMRISTKLNIFLGAPNSVSSMLPDRLSYLTSYFRTDRVNPFFAPTLVVLTGSLVLICLAGIQSSALHDRAAWTLLGAFLSLAIIEHLFLVLPVRETVLWRWAMEGVEK